MQDDLQSFATSVTREGGRTEQTDGAPLLELVGGGPFDSPSHLGGESCFLWVGYVSAPPLFRFVASFARVWIEDSSRNRFALNGIQGIASFIDFSS